MGIILPYNERLGIGDGGFIKPDGEILSTYGSHEYFAKNFCNGQDYDFLLASKYSRYSRLDEEARVKTDLYASSNLTKEQLELYDKWLELRFGEDSIYSEFLVFVLGFDKVETIRRRAITTTSSFPHIRFYNYYLMDWSIDRHSLMKFDKETRKFIYDEPEDWIINFGEDRKAEEEINKIKTKVLIKDRPLFFK